MSYTLRVEIINKDAEHLGWYCPAIDGFVAYPRTRETAIKALHKLNKSAAKMTDIVKDWRIQVYSGKVEYYHKERLVKNHIETIDGWV
ncbi:hypothetical protein D3C85_384760 [compost metagenome]